MNSSSKRSNAHQVCAAEKPSVLFVCGDPLLPLYGGGPVRIFAMVDYLRRQGFRVDVVAMNHGRRLNRQIHESFDRVWFCYHPDGSVWGPSRWTRIRRSFTSRMPWLLKRPLRRWVPKSIRADAVAPSRESSYILRKVDPELCRLAGKAAAEGRHGVVISEFAWTARALDHVPPGVLRIVDTHDIQHLRHPTAQAAGRELPHHRCTREEEVAELERADILLAIQGEEADTLQKLCPNKQVVVTEHALETPLLLASPKSSKSILFVGNLYDPNVSGMTEFLKNSWPLIRALVPESELVVCGRICEAFESNIKGVRFLGVVPELKPFYANAAVVINPVAYGSGLNIKSVEALSFGKCVVGTPAAFRGISSSVEMPFRQVNSSSEMATAVADLLRDTDLRSETERRTHEFARVRFSPDSVYSEFVRVLERHARTRSIPSPEGKSQPIGDS